MEQLNRYYWRSKIGERKTRQIIRCFALDLTAAKTAEIVGLTRKSVNQIYLKMRRRIALDTDEEKIEWLRRKGTDAGFRLANVQIKEAVANVAAIAGGRIKSRRNDNNQLMTFGAVTFEGILEVTDAEKFRQSLQRGIGTGKAYGFGLLSIAKPVTI